jgi:multidrug efflux system outer membrane protein
LLLLQQADLNNQVELYKTLGGGLKASSNEMVTPQPSSAEKHYAQ